ncbi:type I restriction endonuclease subunit R [Planctomonas sp. JC2975]|uniref:type I restriction endonuclease subunit R n=1 Tax=Planctomonas sp. JC2975 TaxID=2729626 RepID=UPI001474A717|nr:type I restriction endonuclease [Planctomonas sp. JC2975]NNC12116.1 type I restriction endonuclease subunit R [Planctomonas sp. JC2975]
MAVHDEAAFEAAIEADLLAAGWVKGTPPDYDRTLGLDLPKLFEFLRGTQPDEFAMLEKHYGPQVEAKVAARIANQLDVRGTLDVLRHGVKDSGVALRLAFFEPPTSVNPVLVERFAGNVLSVIRQVAYEPGGGKELDVVLFVNGIPTATVELKNPLSGQNVNHAIAQYRTDRDPRALIFAKRALVHFAVDPHLVFVTTRLAGADTRFLPFNLGTNGPGVDGGKGNPTNPAGYDTDYLWRQVWAKPVWLDLLQRFVHVEDKSTIFPRFHQFHAVTTIAADVAARGAGRNYLVQHSAGSGKSNTIAWLAHRLSKLHTAPSGLSDDAAVLGPEAKVFDKVVVITDRRVLDAQLQQTIYQFEHVPGVVQKIEEDSAQLAAALEGQTAQVIITTLQKFPYVVNKLGPLAGRRYAVIIDEAHSSASGEGQAQLKKVLTVGGSLPDALAAAEASDRAAEVKADAADDAYFAAAARGRHGNLSFFAFTATPKSKTLELFGTPGVDANGDPKNYPFHVYSMRQAIQEGFILDVLANYVTYGTYYKLVRGAADATDDVDKKKAAGALARYASLHPTNLAQRAEVIVNHFTAHVAHRIGGRAKAIVVTRSRLHALRLYQAIDASIREQGMEGQVRALVAFSGSLNVDNVAFTESSVNGFPESQLPAKFAYTRADDRSAAGQPVYSILVVADKYQTGFDQPLLSAMYVDKKLTGVAAVQTLSRLNRTHPLKSQDDVFVLDFANQADDIRDAFKPFFATTVGEPAEPNTLYQLQTRLLGYQILRDDEIDAYAIAFLSIKNTAAEIEARAHAKLYVLLGLARGRFASLLAADSDRAREFVKLLDSFERQYAFLGQIIAYPDAELEKLYLFGKFLLRELKALLEDAPSPGIDLGDVAMTHLRITQSGEHDLSLGDSDGDVVLAAAVSDGTGPQVPPVLATWEVILKEFNDAFGTDWTDSDLIRGLVDSEKRDDSVREMALNNTLENFSLAYGNRASDKAIEKHGDNETFLTQVFKNEQTKAAFSKLFAKSLYTAIRDELDDVS